MSKLICNRWLHRSILAALLIALGVGIYQVVEPAPMCEMDSRGVNQYWLSPDGRRLATWQSYLGPLRIWDTSNGVEIATYLEGLDNLSWAHCSPDFRYFAIGVNEGERRDGKQFWKTTSMLLVDIENGNIKTLPLENNTNQPDMFFSPDGNLLFCGPAVNTTGTLRVFETATGRLLDRRTSSYVAIYNEILNDRVVHLVPAANGGSNLEIWNPRDQKVEGMLESIRGFPTPSPDGQYLVARRVKNGNPHWSVVIWNLTSHAVEAEIQSEEGCVRQPGDISPDGRWLTSSCAKNGAPFLELREFPSGRLARTTPDVLHYCRFSPDGRFLVLDDASRENPRIVLEMPSLKELWRQSDLWYADVPSCDCNTMFAPNKRSEVQAHDSATGNMKAVIRLANGQQSDQITLNYTPDRRTFLATQGDKPSGEFDWRTWQSWVNKVRTQKNDALVVFDSDTCHVRLRLIGWDFSEARISDNGRILLTAHADPTNPIFRVWDVDAWKPLHWPLGVPAALACLLLLFRGWRKWRTRRKGLTPRPS